MRLSHIFTCSALMSLGVSLIVSTARAAESTTPGIASPFKAGADHIEQLSNGEAKILNAFAAAPGLNGYAVSLSPGHNLILFTSTDGKYILIGGLFGPDGKNLSTGFAQKYLPQVPAGVNATALGNIAPTALLKQAASLHSFLLGSASAPKSITMFIDPNCIYCKLTYDGLKPYIAAKSLKVTVIPVAFLKPTSMMRAAQIIAGPDDAALYDKNEETFDEAGEEGGLPATAQVPDTAMSNIQANTDFFTSNHLDGTPYIIFKDQTGQVETASGMPSDIQQFVAGLPSSKGANE